METLIRKGAEADIYKVRWNGLISIKKIRLPKLYRQPSLDKELRKRRTIHEAAIISAAKLAGVNSPLLYFLDRSDYSIYMEYFDGPRIKDVLDDPDLGTTKIFGVIGRSIGLLHRANLIHGDLTTSNFILIDDGGLGLIDFGLSFRSNRLEDKAVDLHLVKQTLESAHSAVADEMFRDLIDGYRRISGDTLTKRIKSIMRQVERRGRYARSV